MSALATLQQYITKEDFLNIEGLKFDTASYKDKTESKIAKAFLTQEKSGLKSDLTIVFNHIGEENKKTILDTRKELADELNLSLRQRAILEEILGNNDIASKYYKKTFNNPEARKEVLKILYPRQFKSED